MTTRWRPNVLLRVVPIVLLLSACGSHLVEPSPSLTPSLSGSPAPTATVASSPQNTLLPTSTPRPSVPPLSRTLAGARLGMTPEEVRAALGEPQAIGDAPGSGLVEWRYASGVRIEYDHGFGQDGRVREIDIRAPFTGATANSVRIGDSRAAFRLAYAAYLLDELQNLSLAFDGDGITVGGTFDTSNRLISLALFQDTPPRR